MPKYQIWFDAKPEDHAAQVSVVAAFVKHYGGGVWTSDMTKATVKDVIPADHANYWKTQYGLNFYPMQ